MKKRGMLLLVSFLALTLIVCAIAGFGMVASANEAATCESSGCADGSACTEQGECSNECGRPCEGNRSCKKGDCQRKRGNGECSQPGMRGGCQSRGNGCQGRGGCACRQGS